MYNSSYGNGENQPETYKRLLESKTGQRWYYVYARMDGNWSSTSWAVGNVLLSRFPFSTTTRYSLSSKHSAAHGTIVVNGRTINLFSAHLSYPDASLRLSEAKQLKSIASSWAEQRILMGDLNMRPGTTEHQVLASVYSDSWAEGVRAGRASSPSGSAGYTHGSSRFDYVFRSFGATALALTNITVLSSNASDHLPVVATFSVK
jgi:endonuclease/exonuclease/phosphatase family metal-dependent hydrolase